MEFAFKLDGETYEVDGLTLGDARLIADEFGVRDLQGFSSNDPRYMAAMVYLGLKARKAYLTHAQLMAEVNTVDLYALIQSVGEAAQEQAGVEADPTGAVEEAADEPTPKPAPKPRKARPTT